ncbi:glutathione-dependent formaldehyde-activating enzyme family protein (plasmid) [Ochrobactrum quorumnocens]|uniref:Glutathione-dependent formaldehyde-activating enzyme family protein n=2 Tax=Ochrobactrum quorumnocens TaxID=271865 RepID=A0A248UN04_9HYPH|nr:glutathione-dependent formaldehyde-activating enzyme family protein [[Ochrobactrum] quorumnocens]
MHFCPNCGSTVYWLPEAAPSVIGVAVGSFADPAFNTPSLSVFEQSKHEWVLLDETMKHFPRLPDSE